MSKIIAIANNKGRVGKTTTVAALAYAWSTKGYKVLLVDLDSQANLTQITSPTPLEDIEMTVKEAIAYGVQPPITRLSKTLDLIPSGLELSNFENEVAGVSCREFLVSDMLNKIKSNYDVILIDCPPALGLLTYNALVAADHLVMTATADSLSYAGMLMISGLAKSIRENPRLNPELKTSAVIVTKFKSNKLTNSFLRKIRDKIGPALIEPPVREATKIQQATAFKQSIFQYDPEGNATKDYQAVADALEERILKDMNRSYPSTESEKEEANKKRTSINLDENIYTDFKVYCAKNGKSISGLIEEAMVNIMNGR